MELSDYLRVLRAHWFGVLVLTAIGVTLAFGYNHTQPRVYAANANGFVTTGAADNPALQSVNDSLAKSRAKSYVDLATSRATAARVIEDLGLDLDPAGLIGAISVEQPDDTVLIKITATAGTPLLAQELADAWVRALAEQVDAIENPTGASNVVVPIVIPVEAAALPGAPISPRTQFNLIVGLGVGLILGLAYALVRSLLDRRLRSAADINAMGVAVVGTVPEADALATTGQARLAIGEEGTARGAEAAEGFRKLRTNLAYMDVDNPPRTIVVTSPHPSDGKSTVAANLAAAIAISGQAVTIVDGDLRRPSVASSLGLVEGAGLTDVLSGRASLDDVLQQHPAFPGLSILAAGDIPPNPSELLGSRSMSALIQELASRGMVILDAPPLLPVTDAAVLTTHSDGSLVVISYGRTLDADLEQSLGHLSAVNGRVLGVIFNRVPRRNTAGAYYGGYYGYTRSQDTKARRFGRSKDEVRTGHAAGKRAATRKTRA